MTGETRMAGLSHTLAASEVLRHNVWQRRKYMPQPSPSLNRPRVLAYVLLLVAMASWGAAWAAARAVYQDVTPFALVFWRWLLAAVILYPIAARHLRKDLAAALQGWKWLVFFGLSGMAAFPMLGYLGLRHTTAVNASLLNASLPLFMIPTAWLIRRDTVRRRQLAGLALSLTGSLVVVSAGDPAAIASLALNPGDLLILAAVAFWALYTVLLDRCPKMHPLSFTFFGIVVAVVFSAPFYGYDLLSGSTITVNLRTVSAIGYLALFPSVIAYLCWNHAVPIVGPNVASFFNPLVPVFGTLAAVLMLGEQIHGYHLAGFVLVLAGLVLTSKR
jgi:drug/metabolite transporter (DMT)-like permease